MDGSKIQWTDATWNPIRGCSRVSEGCRNCYAERVAGRFSQGPMTQVGEAIYPGGHPAVKEVKEQPYYGLADMTENGPRWTGEVRFVPEKLEDPLRWRRPRMIFVNSMSDLFHEKVPFEWIDRIFAVMLIASEPRWHCRSEHNCEETNCAWVRGDESQAYMPHTFQILTKRPDRMAIYFDKDRYPWDGIEEQVECLGYGELLETVDLKHGFLKNVWLGVSVEDQKAADERIPLLLKTPAAVRWVSYEPALGPVDFKDYLYFTGRERETRSTKLDWIVVGGESGPGARPFYIKWARDVVAQGDLAGVPIFVKQLGAIPMSTINDEREHEDFGSARLEYTGHGCGTARWRFKDHKGGDIEEWPKDLQVRNWPKELAR